MVPKENLLGKEGEGFKIAMQTLEGGRIGIAAQALGIAQGAFEKAVEYAKERVQFGKPISRQQAIAFQLADMSTKLHAARLMVYHAAQKKDAHVPYGIDSAMAKQYASDVALEIVNGAVQIFGGSGYIKGFEVERMYRDAKITTIYEGTNEIQRLVISSALLGGKKQEKPSPAAPVVIQAEGQTGPRKGVLIQDGTAEEKVHELLHQVPADVLRVTALADPSLPISQADHVVSIGKALKEKEDLSLIQELADAVGAQVACSRPLAEERKWFPLDHYVGISGQKFSGSLYIAVGISGQMQHLRGIREAGTIIAINNSPNAPIFKNADYGIVGDLYEILPLLIQALK
jgi:electron transfer flavoprotein alpha subunit